MRKEGPCAIIGETNATFVGTVEWTCPECRVIDRDVYALVDGAWGWVTAVTIGVFHNNVTPVWCDRPPPITIECEDEDRELRAKRVTKSFTKVSWDYPCCLEPNCCGCVGTP